VLVEAVVLDRQHRVLHHRRDLVDLGQDPVLAADDLGEHRAVRGEHPGPLRQLELQDPVDLGRDVAQHVDAGPGDQPGRAEEGQQHAGDQQTGDHAHEQCENAAVQHSERSGNPGHRATSVPGQRPATTTHARWAGCRRNVRMGAPNGARHGHSGLFANHPG
jgi:hypothetical protein